MRNEEELAESDSASGQTWLMSGTLTLESVSMEDEFELTTKSGSKLLSTDECEDVEEGWWMERTGEGGMLMGTLVMVVGSGELSTMESLRLDELEYLTPDPLLPSPLQARPPLEDDEEEEGGRPYCAYCRLRCSLCHKAICLSSSCLSLSAFLSLSQRNRSKT